MPSLDTLASLHGAFTSIPILLTIPLAAILLRRLNPRFAPPVTIHRVTQWAGWTIYLVGVSIGARSTYLLAFKGWLLGPVLMAHIVLGVLVSLAILVIPLLGEAHHKRYKRRTKEVKEGHEDKKPGRTWLTYIHIWMGRGSIVTGIINGGLGKSFRPPFSFLHELTSLGLYITSRNPFRDDAHKTAGAVLYTIAAVVVGGGYLATVVEFELQRCREKKRGSLLQLSLASVAVTERIDGTDSGGLEKEEVREMQATEAQHPAPAGATGTAGTSSAVV